MKLGEIDNLSICIYHDGEVIGLCQKDNNDSILRAYSKQQLLSIDVKGPGHKLLLRLLLESSR